ncbi:MAG: hypothetical protein ABR591_15365, partial [Candidatus Velthaea sp.]
SAMRMADKLGLPDVPAYYSYVTELPVGTLLLGGIANSNFGRRGGAMHYLVVRGSIVLGNVNRL